MNTPSAEGLPEACPFCGSRDISHGEMLTEKLGGTCVTQSQCLGCGAFGPEAIVDGPDYGDALAIAAWNRRTASPAEGRHGAEDHGIEQSSRATFVPCDCGCGRSCCAHCGVDVGFVTEPPADSPATLGDHPVLKRYERACERIRIWCGRPHDEDIPANFAICSWRNDLKFDMELATLMDDMALAIRALAKKPEGRAVAWIEQNWHLIAVCKGVWFYGHGTEVHGPFPTLSALAAHGTDTAAEQGEGV